MIYTVKQIEDRTRLVTKRLAEKVAKQTIVDECNKKWPNIKTSLKSLANIKYNNKSLIRAWSQKKVIVNGAHAERRRFVLDLIAKGTPKQEIIALSNGKKFPTLNNKRLDAMVDYAKKSGILARDTNVPTGSSSNFLARAEFVRQQFSAGVPRETIMAECDKRWPGTHLTRYRLTKLISLGRKAGKIKPTQAEAPFDPESPPEPPDFLKDLSLLETGENAFYIINKALSHARKVEPEISRIDAVKLPNGKFEVTITRKYTD